MAQQTKSKASQSSNGRRTSARNSRSRNGTTARSRSRTRPSSNGSKSRTTARRTATSRRRTPRTPSKKSTMETAKETTVNGAKTAGGAVASAAKQLKTPAIAAGVGLAGVAGGIALGRGTKSKKSLSILPGRSAKATSKKLSDAAKNVGAVAEQTGQAAERVRQLSAAISGEETSARRSPVEVVLEGLTKRSGGTAPRT